MSVRSNRAARCGVLVALAACHDPAAPPPDAAAPWTQLADMPRAALEPGVTAMGTSLVVLGGFDTGLQQGLHISDRVDVFDTLAGTWSQLPAAPVAWTHVDLAAVAGTLYLLGGTSGQEFTAEGAAWRLDPGAPAWTSIAPLPAGLERGAAGVVVNPPHIYLIGGASSTAALASVLDYDLMTDTWAQLPDLPAARSHPAAMRRADNGALLVAGGLATLDASMPEADFWQLAPGAPAWEPIAAPLPTPRGGCVYGALAGSLACAGGEAGGNALGVVEAYAIATGAWQTLPAMPQPRAGTQGAVIGEQLYVPGGAEQLQFIPTSTLYRLDPLIVHD